jgi:zinc protease
MFMRIFRSLFIALVIISAACRKTLIEDNWTIQNEYFNLSEPIPNDPGIIYKKLPNGMRYIIRMNKKPANRAELRLVVNAGSVLEDENQKGLAHFCEHMAFNGTEHFQKQALIDYLESIGIRFGPEINAYTGFDETVYMLEVPTEQQDILETAFQILEDWAHLISFDETEVDKERGVILEEWRLGRGAEARIRDKHLSVLLGGSRYAERLPIGVPAVIDTFHTQTLVGFYNTWYRPDLISIIAVGDFDSEWVETEIEKHFSDFKSAVNERERTEYPVPDHEKMKISIVTDPETTQNRIGLYFKNDLKTDRLVSDYRESIIKLLYDMMFNDRLDELLHSPEPPYIGAFSGNETLTRTKESYFLGAIVEDGGILPGYETLLTEARRVKEYGFTATELERAKIKLLRSMDKTYQERDKTESSRYASEYVRHFTDGEPIPGVEYEYQFFKSFVPGIGLDEINQLGKHRVKEQNLVILVSSPETTVFLPDSALLTSTYFMVQNELIEPYHDKSTETPLLQMIPMPGELNDSSSVAPLGITEWHLSNGLTVVLKPTDFKNDEILFQGFSFGGSSLAPDSSAVAANAASVLVRESGLAGYDQPALEKKLAGKLVRVIPSVQGLTESISGECSPADQETMFQLIYLYFTAPQADSVAYLSYLERLKGFMANRNARPETAYLDTIQVTMADHHPRMRPWDNQMLKEMDLQKSYEFFKDRFADASDFTFYFVGNFSLHEIRPYIMTYLGSLPDLTRDESWRDLGIRPPAGKIVKELHRGLEPKSRVTLILTGDFDWSDRNKIVFQLMLDVLDIRLREEIREEMSGTYGVSVDGSVPMYPVQSFEIQISFGCDPSRVEELKTAVFRELDRLKSEGPREVDFEKVIETQIRTYEINQKKNNYWLNALFSADLYKLDRMTIIEYPEVLQQITRQNIQQMAENCLSTENVAVFILFPETQ